MVPARPPSTNPSPVPNLSDERITVRPAVGEGDLDAEAHAAERREAEFLEADLRGGADPHGGADAGRGTGVRNDAEKSPEDLVDPGNGSRGPSCPVVESDGRIVPAGLLDEEELTDALLEHPPEPGEDAGAETEHATLTDLRLTPAQAARLTAWCGVVLAVLAVFGVLYWARAVFLPIAAAMILNFLLEPLVRGLGTLRVGKLWLPPPIAALVVLLGAGLVLAGVGSLIYPAVQAQLAEAPAMIRDVQREFAPALSAIERLESSADATQQSAAAADPIEGEDPTDVSLTPAGFADGMLTATLELGTLLFATFILLYFLLAAGDEFARKCVEVTPRLEDKVEVVALIKDAQRGISTYLLTITAINCGLGVAIGVSLYLLGMPNPILWGAMATLLNFIPYFGAIVGAIAVGLVAFSSMPDTPGYALLIPAVYFSWTTIEGNFVTPSILGYKLNLNAPVIFAWLLLWGWMWGVPGVLLGVPMLAALKIACDHIPVLRPVGKFLVG